MTSSRPLGILLFALALSYCLHGEDAGAPLLPSEWLSTAQITGSEAKKVRSSRGEEAMGFEILETLKAPYGAQLLGPTLAEVKKGDVLFARLEVRGLRSAQETGEVELEVLFEEGGGAYEKSVSFPYRTVAGGGWRTLEIPFASKASYPAGRAHFVLRPGTKPQILEVRNVSLVNFGSAKRLADLPKTRLEMTYEGREPDAPWRREALARIEKFRKGELVVKTAPGSEVRIRQIRNHFGLGTAVVGSLLTNRTPDGENYRRVLKTWFNKAVQENDTKPTGWIEGGRRELALATADWFASNGIEMRGHVMVWPSARFSPKRWIALTNEPEALRAAIDAHIADVGSALRGKVTEWDVLNEPFKNHLFMDVLGEEEMSRWFRLARQADPAARLFLNDYGILSSGGLDREHQDHFERTIRLLVDSGAPIGGIGEQGHFGSFTPPVKMFEILERYAKFGLPIQGTEFDVDVADPLAQADFLRDYFLVMASHPLVVGVLQWGFWEKRHWKPEAALWDKDWNLRPHGEAYVNLVQEWSKGAEGKADGGGRFVARVWKGTYEVTVTGPSGSATRKIEMGPERTEIAIP